MDTSLPGFAKTQPVIQEFKNGSDIQVNVEAPSKIDGDVAFAKEDEERDVFTPLESNAKSGGYIKRFLQQFSEGSFSGDDPMNVNTAGKEKGSPIRKKVDDICKKCLHYKGQVTGNKE